MIQNNAFQESQSHLVTNTETTRLYNVYLDPDAFLSFRDVFAADLATLNSSDVTVDAQPFFAFFDRWGTHYVESCSVGGQVSMEALVESSFDGNQFNLGISGNFSISNAQAISAAKYQFQSNLAASIDFGYEKTTNDIQKTMTSTWDLVGGDQLGVNLLDAVDTADTIMQWKQSITRKPLPVDYKVKGIHTLIQDPTLRTQMGTALDVYLTTPTDNIITIDQESVFDLY